MKRPNLDLERFLADESDGQGDGQGLVGRLIMSIPLKDRCLLRLLFRRQAYWWEVAGALGISIATLRHRVQQTMKRAEDPTYLAVVQAWDRLAVGERRLLYLHRVLGLSLREIVRQGLAESGPGEESSDATVCPTTLRRRISRIEQKAARIARQVHRRPTEMRNADCGMRNESQQQQEPEEATAVPFNPHSPIRNPHSEGVPA